MVFSFFSVSIMWDSNMKSGSLDYGYHWSFFPVSAPLIVIGKVGMSNGLLYGSMLLVNSSQFNKTVVFWFSCEVLLQYISVWSTVSRSWNLYLWIVESDRRCCFEDVEVLTMVFVGNIMGRLDSNGNEMWFWYDYIHLAQGSIGEIEVEKLGRDRFKIVSAMERIGSNWFVCLQQAHGYRIDKGFMEIVICDWPSNGGIIWWRVFRIGLHGRETLYIFSNRWKVVDSHHGGSVVSLTHGRVSDNNMSIPCSGLVLVFSFILGWLIWYTNIYIFQTPRWFKFGRGGYGGSLW